MISPSLRVIGARPYLVSDITTLWKVQEPEEKLMLHDQRLISAEAYLGPCQWSMMGYCL